MFWLNSFIIYSNRIYSTFYNTEYAYNNKIFIILTISTIIQTATYSTITIALARRRENSQIYQIRLIIGVFLTFVNHTLLIALFVYKLYELTKKMGIDGNDYKYNISNSTM